MDCGCENFVKNQPAGVLRREVNQLAENEGPKWPMRATTLEAVGRAGVRWGLRRKTHNPRMPFGHFFQAPAQGRFELVTGAGQDSPKARWSVVV